LTARSPSEVHDRDRMALVVAAGCLGVSWLIWLAGVLLTLMTTGRWQEVPMVQAPILLVRLISHPNMPIDRWS